MAKAGRRARARALAMARAAAQRRQQRQQDAAEAARRKSTIEELPADILGVLFGCLGFHASLGASHASKTLHKAPDAATRARHRLTLRAMPHRCGGDRDLADRDCATEYLSLGATTTSVDDFGLPLRAPPVSASLPTRACLSRCSSPSPARSTISAGSWRPVKPGSSGALAAARHASTRKRSRGSSCGSRNSRRRGRHLARAATSW